MYTGKPSTILLCYLEDALNIPYPVNDQDFVKILLILPFKDSCSFTITSFHSAKPLTCINKGKKLPKCALDNDSYYSTNCNTIQIWSRCSRYLSSVGNRYPAIYVASYVLNVTTH